MHLIEIVEDGTPAEDSGSTDLIQSVCAAMVGVYQKSGFQRPWIGYLVEVDGNVVGTCGFKSPPQDDRVEIAYFTFPGNEGRGFATQMARKLIQIAQAANDHVEIVAQTLPEENASTAILQKLGFIQTATAHDPEVGNVLEWSLNMKRSPIFRKPKQGQTIAVVGDVYRFLVTGNETNGKYATWEAIVPPGGGPPLHRRSREEESFLILEGEITFQVGEEKLVATAGTFANMPVGSLHCFKNETDQVARMIISVVPAGLEKMFFEFGVPLTVGTTDALPPSKEEIEKLLLLAPNYGIEIMVDGH
jgi:quercetin dioxygenase-like cupin family protein